MLLALLVVWQSFTWALTYPLEDNHPPPLSPLAARLAGEPVALARSDTGQIETFFGLPSSEARLILLPASHKRPLPDGYVPPDLTRAGGKLARSVIVPDLTAMIQAAEAEGVEIALISAYRSPEDQSQAFETAVWQAIGRSSEPMDQVEAEARASRFVAPPGHSQHQLGTAIDFSTWEIGYGVRSAFADTATGRWMATNAWQYGFVMPYPQQGEARSGYAYEPWHYRWVGRDLAAILARDHYLDGSALVVDDYLLAIEELSSAEGLP